MARKNKVDWLTEGLNALEEMSANDLTIETLTTRLGVTKGSFYHHFQNMQDYRDSLLMFFEEMHTLNIIKQLEAEATPRRKLHRLLHMSAHYPPTIEIAIRTWALQDDSARQVQERIDSQRITYLKDLLTDITHDPDHAQIIAQMLYTILIGGYQVMPPMFGEKLDRLFEEVLRLYELNKEPS